MRAGSIMGLSLALALGDLAAGETAPFRDGDRICFVGDSITKQGGYHAEILLFYATRFPSMRLHTYNCGIAGDTAAGAVKRYDWDIAPHRPTVVTVMMGMNDVGRGSYARTDADEPTVARRRQAIDRSIANVEALVRRTAEDGARAILITPSIYDQTGQQEAPCLLGVNDALAACGEGVRRIATKYPNASLVEFHAPMAEINRIWQARDPAFTVVGPDRVHPGAAGHLAMAHLFLKAQGVPGTVAAMELDAGTGAVLRQENCTIAKISAAGGGLAFECTAEALPFPVRRDSGKALELVPFQEDLNREILAVRALPAGTYELRIDGKAVCRTTADALAAGINLAALADTPQYRQANEVRLLVARRHALETKIRNHALLKQQFFPDKGDLAPEDELAILRRHLAELTGKGGVWNTYRRKMIEEYLATPGGKPATEAQRDELMAEIHQASQPVPRRYELARTEGAAAP